MKTAIGTTMVALGVGVVMGSAIIGQTQQPQLVPKLEPVVIQPLPPLPTPRSKAVEKQPKPKAVDKPKYSGPACAEARQGVTMSCLTIRLNAWQYEQKTKEQKAHADGCLTAAERAAIKACFQ